ncbi:MAG TPA: prolipoprotein diacylglyceryl transferase [Candidatus Limnocylindrales bacterium]|nr:prolipoprotein diacylglyceryl transferase [Candidatus Limnocylindrales bacterium]
MIDLTPDPVFIRLFGFPIYWYGIAYAVGLAGVYWVLNREARFRGLDAERIGTGLIIVAVAALIGGRLYHVIDQWSTIYAADPIRALLPVARDPSGNLVFAGFTGLGVPGGIITGTLAAWIYIRRTSQPFWQWADVVAPALFVMQAIGRWGNFFNQELYGPPTTLPWGIRIDCAHRVLDQYPCAQFPITTHFHPLFLYESLSGIAGVLVLTWLARRPRSRLVPGDLLLIFFIWYGLTRFALEGFRVDNWTFFGIPTARIVTLGFILTGLVGLWIRHGPGRPSKLAVDLLPARSGEPSTGEDDEAAFWSDDGAPDDSRAVGDPDLDDEDAPADDARPGEGDGPPPGPPASDRV